MPWQSTGRVQTIPVDSRLHNPVGRHVRVSTLIAPGAPRNVGGYGCTDLFPIYFPLRVIFDVWFRHLILEACPQFLFPTPVWNDSDDSER
jgi:hypothetical protein